jgi:hypothetical protein
VYLSKKDDAPIWVVEKPVSTIDWSGDIVRQSSEFHWPSAVQFGGSLIAILILWGVAASIALISLAGIFDVGIADEDITPLFLLAAGVTLCGVLIIPSAWYSLMRLLGRLRQESYPFSQPAYLFWIVFPLLLFPLVVLSGNWVTSNTELSWLLLPPLHTLAIGLPILWLAYMAVRGLSVGSSQRNWGSFGAGITLSPILIMIFEIGAVITVLFFATVYIITQPNLLNQLELLVHRLSYAPSNLQVIERIITPYLLQPGIIYIIFAFIAVIVPLIEEALKPIGVWLLFKSGLTPAAGFAAGALGGAGYALFENIMFSINADNWILIVTARSGTAAMHIFTGGITGWALATAWYYEKYLQLGLTYLAAVSVHALWNGLTLIGVANQIVPEERLQASVLEGLVNFALVGLAILAFFSFSLIIYCNWILRRQNNQIPRSNAEHNTMVKTS